MAEIFQKRTYELAEYTQLLPTEPGYENPASIWVPVDSVTWPEAKKISLAEYIANLHIEQGPADVSGLTPGMSVVLDELYDDEMVNATYYLRIDAYRIVGTRRENIPILSYTKNLTGFSITLYDYQVGDVIDYIAIE